ncbi:sugar kinase [Sphaerisporangium rufum]|uniref:Sugar kinase n=1 Tax=Sphaerisporangium rufum TaxID=1381558 RepID=A0A919QZP5_9ACTN|nr:ROK family transcriptional regulator [Sphaerisporangium rufum]GII76298.1 sugar kinase [Sphaerisporangium rufum]
MHTGTNLPKVGSFNRSVVLSAIQVSDGISRVQIAARTGLTPQTVSVIVRRLMAEGLVVADGSAPSGGGKPRTILRVDPAAGYAIGVHFDPGEIAYVLADLAGRPVARHRAAVPAGRAPGDVIDEMAGTVRRLAADAGVPPGRVLGAGLACPGPLDADGVMSAPPRLPGWDGVPVRRLLQERTGVPVTCDNDATAAAVGERWAGRARGVPAFAYLYLGTGIGGGLFLADQVYRGRSGNAGEFGHITVLPDGPECYCGNRGCVEAVCRPEAIEAAVRDRLAAAPAPDAPQAVPPATPQTGRHTASRTESRAKSRTGSRNAPATTLRGAPGHAEICAAAAAGDPLARAVVGEAAARVADAAVGIVNLLDIDLLILGGPALREVAGVYHEAVSRAVATRPLARRLHQVRVELSQVEDAAAIGAASLVFHAAYAPRLGTLLSP